MTEKDKIEELINNHTSITCSAIPDASLTRFRVKISDIRIKDFEEFKKQMLKVLLTKEERLKLITDFSNTIDKDLAKKLFSKTLTEE